MIDGAIDELNQKSDIIAQQIEREIRKSLPPHFSVQAEVSFAKGSVIMSGTVLLLTWMSSFAATTIKEEFENQFAEVIRIAIKRVISRAFQGLTSLRFTPMSIMLRHEVSTESSGQFQNPLKPLNTAVLLPTWIQLGGLLLISNLVLSIFLVLDKYDVSVTRKTEQANKTSTKATSSVSPPASLPPAPAKKP